MRLKVEINDLTPEQWEQAQEVLQAEYEIPNGASRMCLTILHGEEERHVEAPVMTLVSVVMSLTIAPAIRKLSDAVRESSNMFTPVELRDPLTPIYIPRLPTADQVRNLSAAEAAEPARDMNTRSDA